MKKIKISLIVSGVLCGAGHASAADTPAVAYQAAFRADATSRWTGFYAGVNGGGAFGSTGADTFGLFAATPNINGTTNTFALGHHLTGGFGGVQAGASRQTGNWVWGAEADVQGGSINGSRTITGPVVACLGFPGCGRRGNFVTASEKVDVFGTIRVKAGLLATPTLLLYGTGGLAWANLSIRGDYHFVSPEDYAASSSGFKAGWTAGAGIEYKFSGNWSVKGEYLYFDLGNSSILSNFGSRYNPPFQTQYNFSTHGSLARLGLNYAWGNPVTVRSTADAANLPLKAAAAAAPDSSWDVEFGTRYFYSSGSTRFTLGDPFVAGQINSRLTYQNLDSHAGEGFARIDHRSGWFAKGFIGAGNIFKGAIYDEDFPPGLNQYSNTVSSVNNGSQWYGTGDFGYNFWKSPIAKVGGFVGYNHFYENMSAYGCTQVATNPAICGAFPIASSVLVLSKTENWDSVRVGLNSVVRLNQWKVTLDGAYLPYVQLNGFDNHWLRPNINPQPEAGNGWGYQLEGILAYELTQNLSLGVGGRYWYARTTSGTSQFPGVPPSPTTFAYDRYGGFLQASYKFGEPASVAARP